MNVLNEASLRETRRSVRRVVYLFIVIGICLIAVSFLLPPAWGFRRELCKELGIVVLSVFTVSIVYEALLAERHQDQFMAILRAQIERGESNAAICEKLGILKIFPTRDVFEMEYSFASMVANLVGGDQIRIVARSLFIIMTHPEAIRRGLMQGARFEFCILDPNCQTIAQNPSMVPGEIQAALSIFRTEISEWVTTAKPPGSITLRFHQSPLLDSCLMLNSASLNTCAWDLSFGRDLSSKRIFFIDLKKPLGKDLWNRYDGIWKNTEQNTSFDYQGDKNQSSPPK
jgi:hypothetical protein